ncbi:Transcriptional regulator [Vibrio chagasii]|jgi:prophage regulatory protein|nr:MULTISPECIES: AlpA family phage regulatory protein [Vibrio]CAH7428859.1 Transcriptional regulator [Vibrio chagasii]CAH7431723.1 Transcriptional regulator [Vibrio chagasii]CAH7486442.1 Transcriptional regulator [Vibrio chagasii]|tara:strand:- start:132 stop:404 length:273 start_codon:yes stop_codon:yes gene_type:complete
MAPLFEAEKKDMANDRYMKIGEVLERTSYSRAQIYRLMKSGEFPSAYRLSKNRVAWKESEVDAWVEERQSIFLVPQLDKGQKLLEEVWRR